MCDCVLYLIHAAAQRPIPDRALGGTYAYMFMCAREIRCLCALYVLRMLDVGENVFFTFSMLPA